VMSLLAVWDQRQNERVFPSREQARFCQEKWRGGTRDPGAQQRLRPGFEGSRDEALWSRPDPQLNARPNIPTC
jgi:hypothetical protein